MKKNLPLHKITCIVLMALCLKLNAQQRPNSTLFSKELSERQNKEIKRLSDTKDFPISQAMSSKQFSSENVQGLSSQVPSDRDGDGLSDNEEFLLKTDPTNPDTDGDALIDSWEVGIINGLDLKKYGASPLHKDIFVEMDYMTRSTAGNSLAPNEKIIFAIREAFGTSLVSNPDGIPGINIHLELGNEIPYDENLYPLFSEFEAIKRTNFKKNKAPVFHYMIWANAYDFSTSSGYSFDIPHSDFIVTLGTWNNNQGGTDNEKIGTFIHELGHNLGLMHGGIEHINFKPNHLSVMNYLYQTGGVIKEKDGIKDVYFTYQPFLIPALEETAILEVDGLGKSPSLTGYYTRIPSIVAFTLVKADGTIDWNGNGQVDSSPWAIDLNVDTYLGPLLATPNEWGQLFYRGGVIGEFGPLNGLMDKSVKQFTVLPFVELTESLSKRLNAENN